MIEVEIQELSNMRTHDKPNSISRTVAEQGKTGVHKNETELLTVSPLPTTSEFLNQSVTSTSMLRNVDDSKRTSESRNLIGMNVNNFIQDKSPERFRGGCAATRRCKELCVKHLKCSTKKCCAPKSCSPCSSTCPTICPSPCPPPGCSPCLSYGSNSRSRCRSCSPYVIRSTRRSSPAQCKPCPRPKCPPYQPLCSLSKECKPNPCKLSCSPCPTSCYPLSSPCPQPCPPIRLSCTLPPSSPACASCPSACSQPADPCSPCQSCPAPCSPCPRPCSPCSLPCSPCSVPCSPCPPCNVPCPPCTPFSSQSSSCAIPCPSSCSLMCIPCPPPCPPISLPSCPCTRCCGVRSRINPGRGSDCCSRNSLPIPCRCKCTSDCKFKPSGGCGGSSCGTLYSCTGASGSACCFPRNSRKRSDSKCCNAYLCNGCS